MLLNLVTGCASLAPGAPTLSWQPANRGLPTHAIVLTLAFDPVDPELMYAGTYDTTGLYRSEDGGQTWTSIPYGLPGGTVYVMLPDPARAGTLLTGTANGLYETRDAGQSWQWLPAPGVRWDSDELTQATRRASHRDAQATLRPLVVYALARDAIGTLYLGGDWPQVFRSEDGGASWEPLMPLPAGTAVLSLDVSADGGLLLAGTDGQGLFLSRDEGAAWQAVEEVGEDYVAGLWIMDEDGQIAYARTRRRLMRTTDGGRSWQVVAPEIEGRVDTLTVDPATGDMLLATDRGLVHRGRMDGENWTEWGQGLGRRETVFALQPAPGQQGTFYAGTRVGLYRSDDDGLSWQQVSRGPGSPSTTALIQAPDGMLYVGSIHGIYCSTDLGEHWLRCSSGLPTSPVSSLALSPADAGLLYASIEGHGLYRSTDGGRTWEAHGPDAPNMPALVPHPTDPQRLYGRVTYARVYESNDGGVTWDSRWEGMGLNIEILSLTVDPHRPQVLYTGSTETLFKSQDGALSWQRIGAELDGQTVFHLVVHRTDADRLYAGATEGVYRSTDGGQTWTRWGQGMEGITVTVLAFHPKREDLIYAGTKYNGVYRSDNGGQTWQLASDGLGTVSVNSLVISPDGHWLLAATSQGIYRGIAR